MKNYFSSALFATMLLPTWITVDGQHLHWTQTPTIITYTILQSPYNIPKDKHILSDVNCTSMQPLDDVIDDTPQLSKEDVRHELNLALKAWESSANISFKE